MRNLYEDNVNFDELLCVCVQIWDKQSLECLKILTGHTGSVLCLQYDERVIVTGSSDSTVRFVFFLSPAAAVFFLSSHPSVRFASVLFLAPSCPAVVKRAIRDQRSFRVSPSLLHTGCGT